MTDRTPTRALPDYLRIAETVTRDIAAGRLGVGDKLPTERAMARTHGVAVATLRKALAVLTERGLLHRRQGSGNYIAGSVDGVGTYALFRLEAHPDGGGLPTAAVLELARKSKPSDLPKMGLDNPQVWHLRRIRRIDTLAVAIEEIWLDGRFDGDLEAALSAEALYRSYHDRLGLRIHQVEDRVGLGPLPDWAPPELGLAPGTQMGLVERRAFDDTGAIAERSQTWFDPDRARYVSRIP